MAVVRRIHLIDLRADRSLFFSFNRSSVNCLVFENNLPAVSMNPNRLSFAKIFIVYFSLEFEIPMHICSGLQIRYVRVQEREKAYSPFRWVRYITHR